MSPRHDIAPAFSRLVQPVLRAAHVPEMAALTQHGATSTLEHSCAVAWYSLRLARALRLRVDERSLVRGALLHDYYLYDWHDGAAAPDRWHGFTHPGHALRNAERDFELTPRERNVISRHMFPLTPVPPTCREAWLVCLADKWCTLREVFCADPYRAQRATLPCWPSSIGKRAYHVLV